MGKNRLGIYKIALCMVLIVSVLMCNACSHVKREGLENYHEEESSVGLTDDLIPDGFLDQFEYTDGNFFYTYDEPFLFTHTVESTLMYLSYDDSVYEDAKNYVMFAFEIDVEKDITIGSIGSYDFYLNNNASLYGRDPRQHFNAFSYNDDIKTLVFIGFDSEDKLYEFENNQIVGFEDLLKTYFPWYDFES